MSEQPRHRPGSFGRGRDGYLATAQADVGLYLDRSVYALIVNVSGPWPVEQISHPKYARRIHIRELGSIWMDRHVSTTALPPARVLGHASTQP